jgi:hypothetical protein
LKEEVAERRETENQAKTTLTWRRIEYDETRRKSRGGYCREMETNKDEDKKEAINARSRKLRRTRNAKGRGRGGRENSGYKEGEK